MSIITTANVTRVTSTDVTIQWGASTPIKWVGYKFSGDTDYTEIYNDLTNVGKLSDYFVINQLTASASYTVTVKMISVTGTVETTDYPVVSFTTPAAGSLAASLKAKLIGNDTVLVIWETNIGLTGLSYTINSGAAVQVPVTAGLTSNSFYIEDIENDDVLVVQFTNSTLVQTLSLTIIISSEDSIGLDEDRTLPAIPVDMSDLLFPYIYFDPLERPRGIITALEWNTLARLLIHQGNYTAKALNQLDLSILQTDPYAVMIKATQIGPGDLSANNVQAKLEELQSETDDLKAGGLTDGSIATAKLADGAVTSDKLSTDSKKAVNLTATSIGTGDSYDGNIQAKLVGLKSEVDTKVDKVEGKELSTNDYDNTEKSDVASNTSARHTHTNKELLDTYTQTEADIADTISKEHVHSNATILDNTTASYTTTEATKLSGIDENANNYSLPTASTSTLGGVKIDGVTVLIEDGVISSVGGGSGADLIDRYNTPTLTQETIGEETVNILSLANELDAYFNKQRVLIEIPATFDNTKATYLNINSLGNKLINDTLGASCKYELIYNGTSFDIKPIMWVGTQEEYDAITTKNICLIYGIHSSLISNSIDKIYYGQINLVFICVGTNGKSYYSTNGTSWTAMSGLNTGNGYFGVAYGNGRFVCVGNSGASYYSTNGTSWTAMTGASDNLLGVTYGNGRFVCVGGNGKSYYSTNGTSWTAMSGLNTYYVYNGVAYGDDRFICVGASGASYYSTNGTSWTAMSGLNTSYAYNGVTYGDDRFICVGASGESYYSTNGTSWTAMTGASGNLKGVTYGDDRFVCVGESGVSYYSTNGESWTAMTGLASKIYNGVAYGDDRFICVGADGKSYYSTDGETWTAMSGLDTSYAYYGVASNK